ncbi:hypothetical protein WJX72_002834 [[Myrmecia] bisecta]|uniref:Uncharacterized protein n=1 Tax=[Myrmecia] bisecta TaxID=41462 RepID=A0AAW1PMB7_9CHLO
MVSRVGRPVGQWQQLPHCPGEGLDRAAHATVVVGKHIYIISGRKGNVYISNMLRFDTEAQQWETVCATLPFTSRAFHTASLVSNEIWVVGGCTGNSGVQEGVQDVWVYNLASQRWQEERLRSPSAPNALRRTAHSCVPHPTIKNALLIFGGYRDTEAAWLADVLLVRTDRREVQVLKPMGPVPAARGYHSCTCVGTRCYMIGGRTSKDHTLLTGRQVVVVYDAVANTWIFPGAIQGVPPPLRSSHRAVYLNDRIVIFGGAGEQKQRFDSLVSLCFSANGGQLTWRTCDEPTSDAPRPNSRAAHGMELIGNTLSILGGYGHHQRYEADAWSIRLRTTAGEACQLAATEAIEAEAPAVPQATGWRNSKRARSAGSGGAANAASPSKRAHILAPAAVPYAELEGKVGSTSDELRQQRHLLDQRTKELQAAQAGRTTAESREAELSKANQELKQQLDEAVKHCEEARSLCREKDGSLLGVEKQLADARSALRTERSEHERKETELAAERDRLKADGVQLKEDNAKAQENVSRLTKSFEAMQSRLTEKETALAALRSELADEQASSGKQRQALQAALDAAGEDCRMAQDRAGKAEDTVKKLEAELGETRERLASFEERAAKAEAAVTRLDADNTRLKAESARLKAKCEEDSIQMGKALQQMQNVMRNMVTLHEQQRSVPH